MSNTKSTCLPLTQEDVFVLRGKPTAKKLTPLQLHGSMPRYEEEWVYYTPLNSARLRKHSGFGGKDGLRGDTKEERFIFKNKKLVGYKTE
jgi:hypothetical protein